MDSEQQFLDLEHESLKLSEDRWERQKRISWWDQELLQRSNILVVGAGTLGNEVCKNLALLGVGNVTIIDYDTIEEVNLSRSVLMRSEDKGQKKADIVAKRMKELYENMNTIPLNFDVVYEYGSANYKDFDIVLMTVDNLEARIYINRYFSGRRSSIPGHESQCVRPNSGLHLGHATFLFCL